MSELDRARDNKSRLYHRIKEVNDIIANTTDSSERCRQKERLRILRDMYRDANEEYNRLIGKVTKRGSGNNVRCEDIFNTGLVWSDLNGTTWKSVEGSTWDSIARAYGSDEMTDEQSKILVSILSDSFEGCTDLQKTYINDYYYHGLTIDDIAEKLNINKSSVSRTIKRGMSNISKHVIARLAIANCIDDEGRFDYIKFVQSTSILTERQTETLYLCLTDDASYAMVSSYINRQVSTVSRTIERAEVRLSKVRVDFIPYYNVTSVKFSDWSHLSEEELAAQLGLSYRFFYSIVRRGETIFNIPLLKYHTLCLLRSGSDVKTVCNHLGICQSYCRSIDKEYSSRDIKLNLEYLPRYNARKIDRVSRDGKHSIITALRSLTDGNSSIVDRIDKSTFAKIQSRRRSSC